MSARGPLSGTTTLVTGIADQSSLALAIAREVRAQGGNLVCAGLGPTPHHGPRSARATSYLAEAWASFGTAVASLGEGIPTLPLDVTLDATIEDLVARLRESGCALHGIVHAIALDRTIRDGTVAPMTAVTRQQFLDCLDVSAYSLLALTRALVDGGVLRRGAGVVALSYLGASRVPPHPYRNIAVAKAALERLAVELAHELGRSHAMRVNVVRYSPWAASRAGGAIPGLADAVVAAGWRSPLGIALPDDLALEVAHLLRPGLRVTGEIRHVDGGYHVLA